MAASDTSYPNNYKYRNLGPFYYRIMKPFIQSEILDFEPQSFRNSFM